ncbi:MAG: STAS domain-containing protein [Geobacteraceae bacterium]|nr:STAS domain-containing protein [Geobacteraceae bacterium]
MRKAHFKGVHEGDMADNVVRFSGSFSLEKGEELRQKLCFAMIDCPSLSIDLSDVSMIDLAGFQLICATHRKAVENGTAIKLSVPLPPHIVSAAYGAGLPRKISCLIKNAGKNSCIWSPQDDTYQAQLQRQPE